VVRYKAFFSITTIPDNEDLLRTVDEFFAVQMTVKRGIIDAQALFAPVFFADTAFSKTL